MTDRIEALERLARLKAEGVLTDAEFEQQKIIILGHQQSEAAKVEAIGVWAYSRQKTRGLRRFFYWFWGIQLLLIVLIAAYVLLRAFIFPDTRAKSIEGTEISGASPTAENAAAASHDETSPPSSEATPYFAVEATITDQTLEGPWNLDGDFPDNAPNRQDACPLGQVSIVNRSSQELDLDIIQLDGDSTVIPLPKLATGMMTKFQPPHVGQFLIRHNMQDGGNSLYLLNVVNCPPND